MTYNDELKSDRRMQIFTLVVAILGFLFLFVYVSEAHASGRVGNRFQGNSSTYINGQMVGTGILTNITNSRIDSNINSIWHGISTTLFSGGTSYSTGYATIGGRRAIQVISVGKLYKLSTTISQLGIGLSDYPGSSISLSNLVKMIRTSYGKTYILSYDYYITSIDAGVAVSSTATFYDKSGNRLSNLATAVSDLTPGRWINATRTITVNTNNTAYLGLSFVALANGGDGDTRSANVAFSNIKITEYGSNRSMGRSGGRF